MYGGILLARFEKPLLNKTTTFTLMMFGVALLLFRAEIYGLQGSPAVAVYLQMYLSLPLVIFSLFAMSYSLESGAAVCKAASLGRKYSLFIYLYHLPLIKIFIKLGDMLSGKKAFLEYHPFILAAGVFAATLIIAIVVDKMTPVVFGALTGKIAFNKVKVRSEYTVK
jgi:hypothetical protein